VPSPRARRRLAWGAVVVGVAAPLARHRLRLPKLAVSVLAWQAPLALALARPRTRGRDAAIYTLQMWAYFAHYDMPDDDPEALRARLRIDYPIDADRAIGLGEVPTVRLQRALGREGQIRAHDVALSIVHWTWFGAPHGSLAFILLRHPRLFPGAACQMAAVFDLGLVAYWVVPTAPPWWAGRNGNLAPVRRIMAETGERFWGRLWRPLYDSLEGNPFAAMPSLHFATSVMAAHVLSDVGSRPGTAGWAYTAALGFGLVYLGEHYVVDLLAGFALAEAVRRLSPLAQPAIEAAATQVRRLEPRFR
jgi:membrane-associated phospholipid phosphatase